MRANRPTQVLAGLTLLAIIAVALGLRLYELVPPDRGLLFAADADEGIYAASARLAMDGFVPYRDYFCSAPPAALHLFMAALWPTSVPWGNGDGFIALRYASVAYGLVTVLAVYAIAARLGGRPAGLLAAVLLAIDGWAVAQDRRAMLEAPMNMFSALAVLTVVQASRKERGSAWWDVLTGLLAALAALTKTQGSLVLGAILMALLMERRWRSAVIVLSTAAAAGVILCLPFLLVAGDDMVRQLYLFQFLRPPNGDPRLILRVNAIRNYAESWLTVRLGLLGAAALVGRLLWESLPAARRVASRMLPRWVAEATPLTAVRWLPVLLWAILVAASFAASKTFYLYYYVQLAVPLSLLAGSLLQGWERAPEASGEKDAQQDSAPAGGGQLAIAPVGFATLIALLCILRLSTQVEATLRAVRWTKPAHVEIGRYLADATPHGARVPAFEPNYAFLASRPLAQLEDGSYFVDSHAVMLYENLDIKGRPWADLVASLWRRETEEEQALLWQRPAQERVVAAFGRVDYVIIDRRARYLLAPETLVALEEASQGVATSGDVVLRQRSR